MEMKMSNRDDVTAAFQKCRRTAGAGAARAVIVAFKVESLDDVSPDKYAAIIAEFDAATAKAGGEEVPESIRLARAATLDPQKVYARWNSVGQRRAARGAKAGEP
jgi:hypothetical protein